MIPWHDGIRLSSAGLALLPAVRVLFFITYVEVRIVGRNVQGSNHPKTLFHPIGNDKISSVRF